MTVIGDFSVRGGIKTLVQATYTEPLAPRAASRGAMDEDDRDREAIHLPIEAVLDLHRFAPSDIPSLVDEYLLAAHAAGLREVRLIHGRGRGISARASKPSLERHPLVLRLLGRPRIPPRRDCCTSDRLSRATP